VHGQRRQLAVAPDEPAGQLDARSDIYALGVVLYEILTGQHPFMAGSFVATTDRIRGETPASIRIFNRSVSPDLESLVNKAMAKDAVRRYQTAGELADDLRRFLNNEPIQARPAPVWP
jgi:serine/threonine-protein kinase